MYFNDHPPDHVHVMGPGAEVVFNLNCPDGPVVHRESRNVSRADMRRIRDALTEALQSACLSWEEIHEHH